MWLFSVVSEALRNFHRRELVVQSWLSHNGEIRRLGIGMEMSSMLTRMRIGIEAGLMKLPWLLLL